MVESGLWKANSKRYVAHYAVKSCNKYFYPDGENTVKLIYRPAKEVSLIGDFTKIGPKETIEW